MASHRVKILLSLILVLACCARAGQAQVVNSQWVPASGNWNTPGNWSPVAAPDNGGGFTYNVQIGTLAPSNAQVTFVPVTGTSATILSLSLIDGADLFTNGFQIISQGQTTIDGAGTTIRIDPHATPGTPSLQSVDLDLNNGGALVMNGGVASVGTQLEVNVNSVLQGFGTVNLGDGDLVVEQAFENSGLIQVQGTAATPGVLTLHTNGVDTIDLDGDTELGVVDVSNAVGDPELDTLTLIVDGPLADGFGSTGPGAQLQIGQRDTITFNRDLEIDANAKIIMDGGNNVATMNGPGDITDIASAAFTITGAAVIGNDMTFSGTANTITISTGASLTLNGTVAIPDASALAMAGTAQLKIGGDTTITEAAADFDWDGGGAVTTTVQGTGHLTITVDQLDLGNDVFDGTINLVDEGALTVLLTATQWTMNGALNKSNVGVSAINGEDINVTGAISVNSGVLDINSPMTLAASSTVTVAAGGQGEFFTTTVSAGSNLTVNGILGIGFGSVLDGPATISGTGLFRMLSTSTVTANTTVNTTSFDWDGLGSGTTQTINTGVVFTINSTTWDADDAGDMDDPINIGGIGGTLAVNNVPSWTMTRSLTTNTNVSGITSLNGNSRMILSGALAIWNANGQTAVNAPVTFGAGSTANIAIGGFIRLNGGDAVSNFNRIEGATIVGPGSLISINAHELRGFGTISAPISFQNTSSLRADDGTLTISGVINEVSTIGTADADGVLSVTNAWNSNVAANVVLNGGTLQGGAITVANANGITGNGLVTSRVVNNTRLLANDAAKTLVFETAANDNDWDGAGNAGLLVASNGGTLEVRDNATFTYGGGVTATGASRVYAKGFGFNFGAASTINLTASRLQTDESSNFAGAINVAAGADSTLEVQVNRFLTIESTSVVSLASNLRLQTNNGEIKAGATFSGAGAVIVPSQNHLILENGANVNVLLDNEGTVRPAGFNTVGVVTVKDYQQTSTGNIEMELTGTLLNQYDRLAVTGIAQLGGRLVVDIDGGFVPAFGNLFNIISAPGGVIGAFANMDVSGMPAALAFHINYFPTFVQLQVVNKPIYSADFDDDGDVDSTDLVIWRNNFNLNQLGDATGDNITNGADLMIWQQQFGSHAIVAASRVVPEPAAVALMVCACAMSLGARRASHQQ